MYYQKIFNNQRFPKQEWSIREPKTKQKKKGETNGKQQYQ